jgi:hypothetical protein
MPRYKCKNIAALDLALSGLPANVVLLQHHYSVLYMAWAHAAAQAHLDEQELARLSE